MSITQKVDLYDEYKTNILVPKIKLNQLDDLSISNIESNHKLKYDGTNWVNYNPTTLSGYGITDAYTKTEVDSKVASVFRYKGSVETTSDLPTSGQSVGDVYNVQTADPSFVPPIKVGDNVCWTGSAWDVLSGTVDLTNYYTKTETNTELAKKQNTLSTAQLNAVDSGVTSTKVGNYDSHIADTTIHVTSSDKSTWNAKQSALSTAQLNAANSGITSAKVSTYDGYATTIANKQDKLDSSNKLPVSSISGLATVATSGSYADLSNKPTIPTVNNATLTIQKNGTSVATFTANSSTDKTANIEVPTKVSDLTNDSGYGTITEVKMNGVSKGTTGIIDLGTVITDVSGKADKIYVDTQLSTKQDKLTSTNAGSGISITETLGVVTISSTSIGSNTLSGLSDVTITAAENGQTLCYSDNKWINKTPSQTTALSQLYDDVFISNPSNEEILKYNGSKWVNSNEQDTKYTFNNTGIVIGTDYSSQNVYAVYAE